MLGFDRAAFDEVRNEFSTILPRVPLLQLEQSNLGRVHAYYLMIMQLGSGCCTGAVRYLSL